MRSAAEKMAVRPVESVKAAPPSSVAAVPVNASTLTAASASSQDVIDPAFECVVNGGNVEEFAVCLFFFFFWFCCDILLTGILGHDNQII